MKDFQSSIEMLRKHAADAAAIRDLATNTAKRETFDRLHRHMKQLADEVEREMRLQAQATAAAVHYLRKSPARASAEATTAAIPVLFTCPKCRLVYQAAQVRCPRTVARIVGSFGCNPCGSEVFSWDGDYHYRSWTSLGADQFG